MLNIGTFEACSEPSPPNDVKLRNRCLAGDPEALEPLSSNGSFRKLGVPYLGVLKIRILLFKVLYKGPLFSETPKWQRSTPKS